MEEKKNADKPEEKDFSKTKFAVLSQTFATLMIAVVGFVFTYRNDIQQDKNRTNQTATQLMADRENSETSFRMNMFQPLIKQILDDSLPIKKRFAILEVFQNNFNDLFNSRSFFDVLSDAAEAKLDGRSSSKDSSEARYVLHELVSLARRTNGDQELQIGGIQKDTLLAQSDSATIPINDIKEDGDDQFEHIKIWLDYIDKDSSFVRIKMKLGTKKKNTKGAAIHLLVNNGKAFQVSYYDSPLTDNTLMPDGDRIAVVLEDIYTDSNKKFHAKLKVIHFPADFVTIGYRPSFSKLNSIIYGKQD